MTSADSSATTELLFGDMLDYMDQAAQWLAAGDMGKLAGLNDTADALSVRIAQLSGEQSREYAPEISHLAEKMKSLQTGMLDARKALAAEMKRVDKQHHASRAYLSAPEE